MERVCAVRRAVVLPVENSRAVHHPVVLPETTAQQQRKVVGPAVQWVAVTTKPAAELLSSSTDQCTAAMRQNGEMRFTR